MKILGIAGVLLVGLGAAACGGSSGTSSDGAAGSVGTAGTTGAAGSAGTAGTTGAAGGIGSHGSCGTVQPCGGALAGSWKASAACILDASLFEDPDLLQACPTASLEPTGITLAGTSTFSANNTFATTGTVTLALKLTLPLSCFAAGKDCAGLQMIYEQQGTFDAPTCSVLGTACVCSLVSSEDMGDSGTYSTSGTTLTMTGADGTPGDDQYCVKGNELHSIGVDMTMPMGPMGTAKIQGDFVFTKQ